MSTWLISEFFPLCSSVSRLKTLLKRYEDSKIVEPSILAVTSKPVSVVVVE